VVTTIALQTAFFTVTTTGAATSVQFEGTVRHSRSLACRPAPRSFVHRGTRHVAQRHVRDADVHIPGRAHGFPGEL
jgi:hypothetical protein